MVILELIHALKPDFSEGPYLLDNRPIFLVSIVVSHSNFSDRMGFVPRQTIQVSAPSAFDGSVLDYHGFHG